MPLASIDVSFPACWYRQAELSVYSTPCSHDGNLEARKAIVENGKSFHEYEGIRFLFFRHCHFGYDWCISHSYKLLTDFNPLFHTWLFFTPLSATTITHSVLSAIWTMKNIYPKKTETSLSRYAFLLWRGVENIWIALFDKHTYLLKYFLPAKYGTSFGGKRDWYNHEFRWLHQH